MIGLAKNDRLKREIAEQMSQAEAAFKDTGKPARVFKDFQYRTLKSWTCTRRVIGKAEFLDKGRKSPVRGDFTVAGTLGRARAV